MAVQYPARRELGQVLVYTVLFLATINNVNRRSANTLVGLVLIGIGVALSILAICQFAGHFREFYGHPSYTQYRGRGSGTFVNPDNLCAFLEMITPIGLAYTLMGRFKTIPKVFLAYATCLLGAGICVTLSRAGWAATGVAMAGFLVVLLFQPGYRLRAGIILGVGLVAACIIFNHMEAMQRRLSDTSNEFLTVRGQIWNIAWRLWHGNILWGIGPGQFDHQYWAFRDTRLLRMRPEYVHNDYLQTLCEWGVAGFALITAALGLLVAGIVKSWRYVRRDPSELGSRNSTKAAFVLGCAFGLAALLLHAFVDFDFHIPGVTLVAVILMAQLTVQLRFATEHYWTNPRILGRCLLTPVLLACAGWIGFQAQHNMREGRLLNQAHAYPQRNLQALEVLRAAAAVEPANPDTLYDLGNGLLNLGEEALPEDRTFSEEALLWLQRASQADPANPFPVLDYAQCLDNLNRTNESEPYYNRACALEPKGYLEPLYLCRHFMILEDYTQAKIALDRSTDNWCSPLAGRYVYLIDDRVKRHLRR